MTLSDVSRDSQIEEFLEKHGWAEATRAPLSLDASTRRYHRLWGKNGAAILMDQPQQAETAACPPDADAETRARLGYNALARLAGANVRAFAAVDAHLCGRGLSAPQILAHDYDAGLLLLEDLGDDLFNRAFTYGENPVPLYEQAAELLAGLHAEEAPRTLAHAEGDYPLLSYDRTALETEVLLLTEWYAQAVLGRSVTETERADYLAAWGAALDGLAEARPVLVLRDYHADNLLWLPKREGAARVGLLDFQDALAGHPAYDLVSLLQDARRDVSTEEERAGYERYAAAARGIDGRFDEAAFAAAYALFNAQRNAKIVGIFTRLWQRDGKPGYPPMVPRVWGYLNKALKNPALAPLKTWFEKVLPPEKRGNPMELVV